MSEPVSMGHTMEAPAALIPVADAAAAAAGVTVRPLEDLLDLAAAVDLIGAIWGRADAEPVIPLDLLRALTHAGGYAAGAFSGEALVGASVGFIGRLRGAPSLHSHVTGVAPEARSRSVGFALKQHQRAWALARDIGVVTWTFDPLVRRNAYFNLTRLGARASEYLPNFYGDMDDAFNRGDESDRLLVVWDLDSPPAVRAAERDAAEPDVRALIARGAQVALASDGTSRHADADVLLCAVPDDIVDLRSRDAAAAFAWRRDLRAALTRALADGLAITGFARDGWYVLERS